MSTVKTKDLTNSLINSLEEAKTLTFKLSHQTDIEFLHQFRIRIRKTRGILKSFDTVFTEDFKKVKKALKKLMKPTNDIRDNDVLIEYIEHSSEKFSVEELDSLHRILEALGSRKERFYSNLDSQYLLDELDIAIKKMEKAKPACDELNFKEEKRRFIKLTKPPIKSLKPDSNDEDFHEVRILLKAFRYTLEVFSENTGEANFEKELKRLKKNQNALGRFQDATIHLSLLEHLEDTLQEEIALKKLIELTRAKKDHEKLEFLEHRKRLIEILEES